MKKILFCIFLISFFATAEEPTNSTTEPETPYDVFENVWEIGKNNIYPFANILSFTESNYRALRKKAAEARNLDDIADIVNPFLDKIHVSHTQFYTKNDFDYYYLKSILGTHDPHQPKVRHIGAQYAKIGKLYYVRTVLDGYPAQKAGLRRGDKLLKVNGVNFHPVHSFIKNKPKYVITFERKGKTKNVTVKAVYDGLGQAFTDATRNSVKVLPYKNKKVGYVHLWSGAYDSDQLLAEIVEKEFLNKVDAVILDLRDGYGAAWWDHLDPFYTNRDHYFVATSITRYGDRKEMKPEKKTNPKAFTKQLIVLTNRGTRSGKEALAFQFKKTRRATIVGTQTAGYFVAGKGFFADQDKDYLFYLSSGGYLLDGVDLEGFGVKPDVWIDHKSTVSLDEDPQLTKAMSLIEL